MTRIFINGFGRIGRSAARIILDDDRFELVGINDLCSFAQMEYLLKFDSVYQKLKNSVKLTENRLIIDEKIVELFSQNRPENLDIKHLNVDVVLECSGMFLSQERNEAFLKNGSKKVLVSTPASDDMPTYVYGVNHEEYKNEKIISNSSCSATAIVPILKIIDKHFGIKAAMMSMYHSYTSYQNLLDGKHHSSDIRRTRSATLNIIPIMSSAAKATEVFFPKLKNKFHAKSIRVPIPSTTLYELDIKLSNSFSSDEVNKKIKEEVSKSYKNVLDVTEELQCSEEYVKNPHSAVINLPLTSTCGELLRVSAWQDNEYGYAKRLLDMANVIA